MVGDISRATNIYIVCGYTDMRKSIDGLCAPLQKTACSTGAVSLATEFQGSKTHHLEAV